VVTERAQDTDSTNQRKAYGYFFQHVVRLAKDRLQLSVSWRWDDEKTENRNLRSNTGSKTDPKSTDAPRFGVSIRPIEALTVYALRSEQADPQTSTRVWTGLAGNHPRYNDQFPSQVVGRIDEAGLKAELFDRKLSATLSWFTMYRDGLIRPSALTVAEYQSLGLPVGAAGYNRNLLVMGEETQGWELEWFGQVTPRLAIFGGYGRLQTEAETNGVRGPTRGVPEFKLTSFAKYDFRGTNRQGWEGRLGVAMVGPQFANQNTELGARYGTSVRIDAGATYDWKKYSVAIQIKNLTNATQVISAVAPGSNRLAAPREAGVTLSARW
jgi:iron complex outermembrane receptor protein